MCIRDSVQGDLRLHLALEPRGFRPDLIAANREAGKVVNSLSICLGWEDYAAIQILRYDFGTGDGGTRGIGDRAGNSRANLLAPGGARQGADRREQNQRSASV